MGYACIQKEKQLCIIDDTQKFDKAYLTLSQRY